RAALARVLNQLLYALVRVRASLRIKEANAPVARAVTKEFFRRTVEHNRHTHLANLREPCKLIHQSAPRLRLIPVPAHTLRHHIVAINEIHKKQESEHRTQDTE